MAMLLFEAAVRAILIAAGTGLALWLTRVKSAGTRHAAWTAVLVTMLVLPAWTAIGPRVPVGVLQAAPHAVAVPASAGPMAPTALAVPEPLTGTTAAGPAAAARAAVVTWPRLLLTLYLFGVGVLLARLAIGTVFAHRLRRRAMLLSGRTTSDRIAAPITVGWRAPTLILPAGWQEWPSDKLSVVLAHEGEHARRRDPLVQWLALLNRAVFWFHPLAWWLERRIAALSEERCDAAVLAAGHSAAAYSACLIELARSVARRGHRVQALGMAMPGGHLVTRLHRIADAPLVRPTSRARLACTVALCATSTALFAAAALTPRRPSAVDARAAQVATTIPKFDVVSVKPCAPGERGAARGTGAGTGSTITSPGRLDLACYPLSTMLDEAYVFFAEGRAHALGFATTVGIEGEPDWTKSERYTIEATTEQNPPAALMRGPMLQAVLEDRFRLKVHRETRQMPVYELVVAKGGAKVSPYTGHDCVVRDESVWPPQPPPAGQRYCGDQSRVDGDRFIRAGVMTLDMLAELTAFDRPVVNKTGISAPVSVRLEYPVEDAKTRGEAPSASFINALLDQLGLDLRPSTGPRDFLVIDHVERPTPDGPAPSPPARAAGPGAGRP